MGQRIDREKEADRILRERGFLIYTSHEGVHVPSRSGGIGDEWVLPHDLESCPCPDHRIRFATCAHMRCAAKWKRMRRMHMTAAKNKREERVGAYN